MDEARRILHTLKQFFLLRAFDDSILAEKIFPVNPICARVSVFPIFKILKIYPENSGCKLKVNGFPLVAALPHCETYPFILGYDIKTDKEKHHHERGKIHRSAQ